MEKICSSCRYAYKDSEQPCAICSSNYTNKWERATDEQIMLIKSGIFDFRNRLEKRLLEIKAKRQDAALENMSDEDLDKALAELSD